MAINLAPPPRQEPDINTWQWKEWLFSLYQKLSDVGSKSSTDNVTVTPGSDADYTQTTTENAANVVVLDLSNWAADHNIIRDDADRKATYINPSTNSDTATITTDGSSPTTVEVPPDGTPYPLQTRAGVGVEQALPDTVQKGAIVESGSNSNGSYVRWENGEQVCFVEKDGTYAGSGAASSDGPFNWPAAFNSIVNAVCTMSANGTADDGNKLSSMGAYNVTDYTILHQAFTDSTGGSAGISSGDSFRDSITAWGFWK